MSAPVITDPAAAPLGVRNGTFDDTNVRWVLPLSATAILCFPVFESGNATPYVKIRVSWGDGSVEETDLRPVGRPYNYLHEFSEAGDYNVLVEVFNSDFLPGGDATDYQNSHAAVAVPIRITALQQTSSSNALNQWRGLALPPETLQDTFNSVENPPISNRTVGLANTAVKGALFIVLTVADFVSPGDRVTITETGRLITSARVLTVDQTVVTLDASLSDDYTLAADVSVQTKSPNTATAYLSVPAPNSDWFFPSSATHALVQSEIRMILATRPFERVMLPEFGSGLHKIPFEQNDSLTDSLVRRYTLEAIQLYAPRAEIVSFGITRNNNDLNIQMSARIKGDDQTFSVAFSLLS